jgi:hypothetical protein
MSSYEGRYIAGKTLIGFTLRLQAPSVLGVQSQLADSGYVTAPVDSHCESRGHVVGSKLYNESNVSRLTFAVLRFQYNLLRKLREHVIGFDFYANNHDVFLTTVFS